MPYFGICFGMQMAVIEAARDLAGIDGASSTEFGPTRGAGGRPDDRMDEGQRAGEARSRTAISAAPCGSAPMTAVLAKGSKVAEIYGTTRISERHRHRYEVNIALPRTRWRRRACASPACRRTALLPEIVEIPDHPWFIGVQFHPELKSRPFEPHPLFASFIGAAVEQSRLV